jgi:hypothetical protein
VKDENQRRSDGPRLSAGISPQSCAEAAEARGLKAEVNLLRLPLFALHTKGLSSLEGIECRGRVQRDGQMHEYLLRVSRNTASLYPGPLSRKTHFALLSIATERGFPLQNPIAWSWRDLCRRMDIAYGGQKTLGQLKTAIRSTHGVVVHSEYALYSRSGRQPLALAERGHHLYDDYAFCNEPREDGTVADTNAVWFADWYLDNLNTLYSAPIDYRLWKSLESRSPIASRLYEFLLVNLYSGAPVFRINYANLARLLPVRTERYLSDARKQLGPAIVLLKDAGVIAAVQWHQNPQQTIQLRFTRGPILRSGKSRPGQEPPPLVEESLGTVQVQEIRDTRPMESHLVRQFYELWSEDTFAKPTPKELSLARGFLQQYGRTKLHALLPLVVKRLKEQWPEAKTFGAIAHYLSEVNEDYDRKQEIAEQRKQEQIREQAERQTQEQKRTEQRQFLAQWRPVWEGLSDEDRDRIRQGIRRQWPHIVRVPEMYNRYCIEQLARERASVADDEAATSAALPGH